MKSPADPAAGSPAALEPPQPRATWLNAAGKVLRFASQRAGEEKLFQVAASLTFTTVLAIVPMLAVVLSLFTAFPVFQEFRIALENFLTHNLMPPAVSDNIMEYLNQFAHQATRLTTIGAVFLVITSVLLIMTIDKTFNDIWHVARQRPLHQRALIYWAVITLGPVVAGASLWATSFVARESLGLVRDVPEVVSLAISFFPLILTGLGFAALFVVVPNQRISWKDALAGGAGTAVVLEIMKSAFAYYLTRFPTYTVIYGAFATLPIFLLWIYSSWLAVLFGATVAASLPLIRLGRWEFNRCPGAAFIDAIDILRALHAAQGGSPPGLGTYALARRLRLHHDELISVLESLVQLGWVAQTSDQRWLLACDARKTSLEPIFDRFLLDRSQPRARQDPTALRVSQAILQGNRMPTLEELAGVAQNTANGAAQIMHVGANKKFLEGASAPEDTKC